MAGALAPGRVVERYRVEERLGEGGTAVVWRVRHVHLGTEHALKVMTLLGAQAGPRLLLEGRVQAGLRHPNIVAVSDVLEIDGGYGLLMEYVPPPSLGTWLQQHGAPPVEVAEALFRGVVEGVRHAHAHGLVHRDLKPANVLLARDPARPETFVPKVADFGLARLLDEEGGHRHTRSGLAMGTPQYMAPEQFRDAKSVDRRADLFSLGCILHELLSGVPAFAWTDMIGVYEAMLAGRFAPLPDGVPARLRDAVAGCLVADRDARIPDCGTLLAVLDGAPHGATLVPRAADRAPTPPVDAGATLAPRRFDAAATLALPDTRTPTLPTLALPEAPAPSPVANPVVPVPPGGSRTRPLVALGGLAVAGLAAFVWIAARSAPVESTIASPPNASPLTTVAAPAAPVPSPAPTGASASTAAGADLPSPEGASRAGTGVGEPPPSTRSPASTGTPAKRAPAPNTEAIPTEPAAAAGAPVSATPPAPAPAPPASPAPATTARARASGADAVWLVGPDGRQVLPATVTPGRYAIWADFGAGAVDAGEAALSAGDDVSVVCNASFTTCRVRR